MWRRPLIYSGAIAIVVLLMLWNGCSPSVLEPADIRPLPFAIWRGSKATGSYAPVKGIQSALLDSPGAPVRVLVVHGMKTDSAGYSRRLQEGLVKRLALGPRPTMPSPEAPRVLPINRGYGITMAVGPAPLDPVTLRRSEIRRHAWADSLGHDRIVFYEMLWAPLRDDVKDRFFACFETAPREGQHCPPAQAQRNTGRRDVLSGRVKDEVLVDGIADATIVLGPVGDVLRDDVGLAFCHIALDILTPLRLAKSQSPDRRCDLSDAIPASSLVDANEKLRETEFFVLTHSLGSFLVMDAQWHDLMAAGRHSEARDEKAMARDVSAFYLLDDATVFMRANQIGLLQLARLKPVCAPPMTGDPCPNDALQTEDDAWELPGSSRRTMTTYVGFNDVNDLLGFELPPYLTSADMLGTMVNVTVRNPTTWSIPFLFKNPGDAHLRSDENPAVLNAIAKGFVLPPPVDR